MKRKAKAAVWVAPNKIEIMEVQIPDVLDDGMLIKVNAAGICGTDGHIFPQTPPRPSILGHELSGTIVEMGKNANKSIKSFSGELKEGDRVTIFPWTTCGVCINCLTYGSGASTMCDDSFVYGIPFEVTGLKGTAPYSSSLDEFPYLKGGFAEYMYILPGTYVWQVPDDIPDSIAALMDPLACSVRTAELAIYMPGVLENSFDTNATMLVIGDGQSGAMSAMVARIMGIKTIIIAGGREERLSIAQKISKADYTMNYHKQSLKERKDMIDDLTKGLGADIVLQCAGTPQAFKEGIALMKRVGTLVEMGNMVNTAPAQFDIAEDLCRKHATYKGMSMLTPATYNLAFNLLFRHKEFGLERIISHECTLDTLEKTLLQMKEPAYMKGMVRF